MDINNFINPIKEREALEEPENIIEHVAAQFAEQDESDEELGVEQPKIKISEALAALQQLQLYEEQQDGGNSSLLCALNKYEQQIQNRRINKREQTSITAFFNAASSRSEA